MNNQEQFIKAVESVSYYMDRRSNFLTDDQRVLVEGELTMFLTNAFIKQAEADKKEPTVFEVKDILKMQREYILKMVDQEKSNR